MNQSTLFCGGGWYERSDQDHLEGREAIALFDTGALHAYLDVIVGAITMEHWEITVNPKQGELGLDGLRRREFTEY